MGVAKMSASSLRGNGGSRVSRVLPKVIRYKADKSGMGLSALPSHPDVLSCLDSGWFWACLLLGQAHSPSLAIFKCSPDLHIFFSFLNAAPENFISEHFYTQASVHAHVS